MAGDTLERRQRITLGVGGHRYTLVVPARLESRFRRAEEDLLRAYELYERRFPTGSDLPPSGYLGMAALDVAVRLERAREELSASDLGIRLERLNSELAQAIGIAQASLEEKPQ